jgi:hypothetical protein
LGDNVRRLSLGTAVLVMTLGGCSAAPAAARPAPPASTARGALGNFDAKRDSGAELKAARAASAKDHRNLLVDFGSATNPDCLALSRLSADPAVVPLLANYHVVDIDVDDTETDAEGLALNLWLDLKTSGLPALTVVAPGGQVLVNTNDGSFAHARTMTPEQLAAFLQRWKG